MTATAPLSATTSRPSRKGKNALDATTLPASDRPALAASIGRLKARMPPNAEVGSVASAARYASSGAVPSAAPQGFACLTITHADSAKLLTHSHAASLSAILLYDSSLP